VWIASQPQDMGRTGQAKHPGVQSIEKGMGAMLLGVVEGDPLLCVLSGWNNLSKKEKGIRQRHMGLQEEIRVLYALSQMQELLSQLVRRLQLRPHQIKRPQSKQHREELRGFS